MRGFELKSDKKSWTLVLGFLIVLAACILAYSLTKPAEADVASLDKLITPSAAQLNFLS